MAKTLIEELTATGVDLEGMSFLYGFSCGPTKIGTESADADLEKAVNLGIEKGWTRADFREAFARSDLETVGSLISLNIESKRAEIGADIRREFSQRADDIDLGKISFVVNPELNTHLTLDFCAEDIRKAAELMIEKGWTSADLAAAFAGTELKWVDGIIAHEAEEIVAAQASSELKDGSVLMEPANDQDIHMKSPTN